MRVLKWVVLTLFALVLIVLLFVGCVLFTEPGTRFAINAAQRFVPQLSIGAVNGTFTKALQLASVNYNDDTLIFSAKSLAYDITGWSLSTPMLVVKSIHADGIDVHLPYQETTEPVAPFQGFVSPVALSVEAFDIQHVRVFMGSVEQPVAQTPTVQVNQLTGGLALQSSELQLDNIDAVLPQQRLQASGQMRLTEALPFSFTNSVTHRDQALNLMASGSINGSLTSITLDQRATVSGDGFAGRANLGGSVALGDDIVLSLRAQSNDFTVQAGAEQSVNIERFEAKLQGPLSGYTLQSSGRYRGFVEQPTDLTFTGAGSTERFDAKQFRLQNGESILAGKLGVAWTSGLQAQGQVELTAFNAAQFVPEYPSNISGTARFSVASQGDALRVDVPDFAFDGELKAQPFTLTGQLDATNAVVNLPQFLLRAGDNRIEGQLSSTKEGELSGAFDASLNTLDIVLPELEGRIRASIAVSGAMQSPIIALNGQLDDVRYQEYAVASGRYTYEGQPLLASDAGQLTLELKTLAVAEQTLDALTLQFTGGQEQQAVELSIAHPEAAVFAKVAGRYDATAQQWVGALQQNRLTANALSATVTLQEPMALSIDIAKGQSDIGRGCWRDDKGLIDACVESTADWQAQDYQLDMALNALSAQWLRPYLKEHITLRGVLSGPLAMQYKSGDVLLNAQLKTQAGHLLWQHPEEAEWRYESDIETFEITATSSLDTVDGQVRLRLDANNYLDLNMNAAKTAQAAKTAKTTKTAATASAWQLDGKINGQWSQAALLADILPEVSEAKGVFRIDGQLQGPVDALRVNLAMTNTDGYILPNRTGTKLENIALEIIGAPNQADMRFAVQSGGGTLSVTGQANYDLSDLSKWQFYGQVEGKQFELIDVPELLAFASPTLQITADAAGANITGDVVLDTTTLTVEQLPPSAKTSSSDVVIHRDDAQEAASGYPVIMNVRVKAPAGVNVNALGFVGEATGELTLRNDQSDKGELLAYGALTVDNGTYEVLGQVLTIRNSSVVFSGPMSNPTLAIFATRTSLDKEVLAGVKITGTPKKIQTDLYSEPSLSDAETLSYITTGKGLEGDSEGLTSAQLVQAAILLGVDKAAAKFPGVISAVGIDRFRINEAAESEDSSVEVGRNVTDSVYVGYDYGLFNRLGFWVLEYQLTRALSLESRYGDSQSIDLKYQFSVE